MTLFKHKVHPHTPTNVNETHKAEQATAGFNERLAVKLTKATSTMLCAYFFVCLALLGFPALSAWLGPMVAIYVVWFSQTFLQLVFLPVLSVGQGVLGHHAELMADEQFKTTQRTYHDIEQVMHHLDAQDTAILAQTELITKLIEAQGQSNDSLQATDSQGQP